MVEVSQAEECLGVIVKERVAQFKGIGPKDTGEVKGMQDPELTTCHTEIFRQMCRG